MSQVIVTGKKMMIWNRSKHATKPIVVNVENRQALLEDLGNRFDSKVGFSIATLNLDHVVKLGRDVLFSQAYAKHSHVTADGNPIVWLCRLAGQSDVELVPGSELIDPVAALAAKKGISVAIFGSTDESLQAAAAELEHRHSGLKVVYSVAPPMGFDPDGEVAENAIRAIGASGAKLTFLALGAPKQERFAARATEELLDVGFLSIGAGLDFISGRQKRAPKIVRLVAAEWLWRMLSDPRRLGGRYIACIGALPHLTVRALKGQKSGQP